MSSFLICQFHLEGNQSIPWNGICTGKTPPAQRITKHRRKGCDAYSKWKGLQNVLADGNLSADRAVFTCAVVISFCGDKSGRKEQNKQNRHSKKCCCDSLFLFHSAHHPSIFCNRHKCRTGSSPIYQSESQCFLMFHESAASLPAVLNEYSFRRCGRPPRSFRYVYIIPKQTQK